MQQTDRKIALYHLAESQAGLFTSHQAENLGFDSKNFHHFIKTTEWARMGRGLYRLAVFPTSRRQDFWELYLWTRNKGDIPQGVFSHESALDLYDLTDELPSEIHMTVPGDFRRNSQCPSVLRLYREDLKPEQIQLVDGLPCTTPSKTVLDLHKRKAPGYVIKQAIREGAEKGLISRKESERLQHELQESGAETFDA